MAADDKKALWALMLGSVSSFATLFRHALIALGGPVPASKREVLRALATRIQFDPIGLHGLLDIREGKAERSQFDVADLLGKYLSAIQIVTASVDKMLDSPETGRS